jgi:dTDP-4-dehydrorhamnose reductase
MDDALIGHSGFVGNVLERQAQFAQRYRSSNIAHVRGQRLGTVVCAAAPAQKWIANRDPAADRANIDALIGHLDALECERFVLISTVDVFKSPIEVDEETPVDETGLHAYGLHRRLLEKFVQQRFARHLVVRLPGLVGPGLRKNVIFDFLNDNNVQAVESRGVFQFYPMVNLWADLQTALQAGLHLLHLTAEPLSVADVSQLGFGRPFRNHLPPAPASYDLRTRHAAAFGSSGPYQYDRRASLLAIRAYAQTEPRSVKAAGASA